MDPSEPPPSVDALAQAQHALLDEIDGFMDDAEESEHPTGSQLLQAVASNQPAATTTGLSSAASAAIAAATSRWDPLDSKDWDQQPASQQCLTRIKRDIMSIYQEPPHGIFVVLDEDNMTIIHALVVGPFDTPYEGGFFYFVVGCPPDYPIRPPRVRLMTTDDNTVRFNPNLYRNGKVCLSILGTWSGPSWSPAQSIASVLVSIQSLMSENPYHNEPGYEQEHRTGESARYNQIIRHETLRVAVCDMLEGRGAASARCPDALKDAMKDSFAQFYSSYVSSCEKLKPLNGTAMRDPFHEKRGKFDTDSLLKRLQRLHESLGVAAAMDEEEAERASGAVSDLEPQSGDDSDIGSSNDGSGKQQAPTAATADKERKTDEGTTDPSTMKMDCGTAV